jgi:hypothetical protein
LSGFCTGVAGVPGLGYAAALNLGQRTPQEDLIFVGYQVIDESSTEYKRYENVYIISFFYAFNCAYSHASQSHSQLSFSSWGESL